MSEVEARLAAAGHTVPEATTPLAAYVPAVVTGRYVYTSGQLPVVAGELIATGRVGVEIEPEQAAELAERCALNAIAAIKSVIGDLDKVVRVVKVVGFVASDPEFFGQPAVMNGASNLLLEAFGEAGRHARSAVGVAALPRNAPVEVEVIVEVAD
ncbi:MAG: RidA family protein [Candidatus Nanopelagicales bacterium]